jgi:hypothetical protein
MLPMAKDISERFGTKKVPRKTIRELVESGALNVVGDPPDWEFYANVTVEQKPEPIKIADSEFSAQKLEHFGDAIIAIAARMICHELFKKESHRYFLYAGKLITNQNLKSCPKTMTADQFEIRVGDCFVKSGIEAAVVEAITLLKNTSAYFDAKDALNDKS